MDKKSYLTIIIAIIILSSAYCIHTYYTTNNDTDTSTDVHYDSNPTSTQTITPTNTLTPEIPTPTSITVTDGTGNTVIIPLPVTRIAVLDGTVMEILGVLGIQDLLVARCDSCTMPPSVLTVPSVGVNDYRPNAEALIDLQPDVIFASLMLPPSTAYQQLKESGIPIYIVNTTIPEIDNPYLLNRDELYTSQTSIDFICNKLQDFTVIFGHQEQATEYINWAQSYNKLVKDRIYNLSTDQRVKVFLEWYSTPYRTWVTQNLYQAGGINIAENQSIATPVMAPEFIIEQNPSVLVLHISSNEHNIDDFIAARDDVLNREIYQSIDAVKNGQVYVLDFAAKNGPRTIVGYLYLAKWIQPDLFLDIDPAAVNQEFNQKFYGITLEGTYGYM
jgi:iron complex transport system substrate-binding protein